MGLMMPFIHSFQFLQALNTAWFRINNDVLFGKTELDSLLIDHYRLGLKRGKVGNPRQTGNASLFLDVTAAVTLAVTTVSIRGWGPKGKPKTLWKFEKNRFPPERRHQTMIKNKITYVANDDTTYGKKRFFLKIPPPKLCDFY